MIQITSNGVSKQVLRLSSGEYTFKPGNPLTLKKYNERDVTFLHSLGYRIINLESKSSGVKEVRKPAPLPKGVTLVEKKPEVNLSSSVLTSSEFRKAVDEHTPVEERVKFGASVPKRVQPKPVQVKPKPVEKKQEPVEPVKESVEEKQEPEESDKSEEPEQSDESEKDDPSIPEKEQVSTKELKMRKPRKKRSSTYGSSTRKKQY